MRVDHEKKSDGVRPHHEKKSDRVRLHHERKEYGVRVDHERKGNFTMQVYYEKEQWGENSP